MTPKAAHSMSAPTRQPLIDKVFKQIGVSPISRIQITSSFCVTVNRSGDTLWMVQAASVSMTPSHVGTIRFSQAIGDQTAWLNIQCDAMNTSDALPPGPGLPWLQYRTCQGVLHSMPEKRPKALCGQDTSAVVAVDKLRKCWSAIRHHITTDEPLTNDDINRQSPAGSRCNVRV